MKRGDLIRWLKTESHVMPARKRRAFGRFLDSLDPPQGRLPLRRKGQMTVASRKDANGGVQ